MVAGEYMMKMSFLCTCIDYCHHLIIGIDSDLTWKYNIGSTIHTILGGVMFVHVYSLWGVADQMSKTQCSIAIGGLLRIVPI